MALNGCNLDCDESGGALSQEFFRVYTDRLLWNILQAVGGGSTETITPLTAVTIASGAITNAYVATTFLATSKQARYIFLDNQTDADLILSADGVNAFWIVPANGQRAIPFSPAPLIVTTDLYLKYSYAPTRGQLIIEGYY
jgi:hypothetical protein